jgi:antitoxin MazE
MRVAKWGNSLAVRLPASIVEALDLKAGDEINIRATSRTDFDVARKVSREEALELMRKLAKPLPPGFKFSRDEANER